MIRQARTSFRRSRTATDDDARILPLINVVFLLLIFFMLAGRLSTSDPFEIEPPHSRSEQPPEAQTLEILVAADGRLALDNRVVEETQLRTTLQQRLNEQPDLRIRLRADGRADTPDIVGLMELLREAGVASLHLLTLSGIE